VTVTLGAVSCSNAPADRPAPPANAAAPSRPLRVLLAEDNAVNRILAQRQLAQLGHQLDTVKDGQAAIEATLAGEYDLVLMDRHLPGIDGVEAARRIRAEEARRTPPRRTPIVAMTADAQPKNRDECLAAGMDEFVTKPIDLDRMRVTLAAFTPAPTAAADAPDGIDPATLGRLADQLGGDLSTIDEMISSFLTELPDRRLRLQLAIRHASPSHMIAAANSLQASSTTVGAVRLAGVCGDILDAARASDAPAANALLGALLDACDRTATRLEEMTRDPHRGLIRSR
jgi:CheY-like chemotaxis protein